MVIFSGVDMMVANHFGKTASSFQANFTEKDLLDYGPCNSNEAQASGNPIDLKREPAWIH